MTDMPDENKAGTQPDAAAIAREIRAQEAAEKKAKEADDAKKMGQGCLVLLGIIVIVAGIIWFSNSGNNSSSSSRETITLPNGTTVNDSEAVVMCRNQIRDQLVSPGSARFQGVLQGAPRPVRTGNNWTQVVQVDAQNAFGATVRSHWNCEINGSTGMITVRQR